MLDMSSQSRTHTHAERGLDCYETPPVAVRALLRVEQLPQSIWEPACGHGNIVKELRAAGHTVYASDIADYACGLAGVDFLTTELRPPADAILTNPPFKLIQKFVERALELSPLTVMLCRLAFYESDRRRHILENCGLARIHVFRKRLPMMHRAGWEGRKANSGMAFCWMVWDRNYSGPTVIDRISWEE